MIRLYVLMGTDEEHMAKVVKQMQLGFGWQVQEKYSLHTIHGSTHAWQLINITLPKEESSR